MCTITVQISTYKNLFMIISLLYLLSFCVMSFSYPWQWYHPSTFSSVPLCRTAPVINCLGRTPERMLMTDGIWSREPANAYHSCMKREWRAEAEWEADSLSRAISTVCRGDPPCWDHSPRCPSAAPVRAATSFCLVCPFGSDAWLCTYVTLTWTLTLNP